LNAKHFFLVVALVACSAVFAERADKNKPINLEADSMTHDEARQTSTLEGGVVLTKGTLVLRANRVEVRKDAQENQFMTATAKTGERVLFRQKREGLDEFMEGEASRIEYDGKQDVVRLSGNAVMRRLRGSLLADESVGSVIVFNNITETLTINGAAATSSQPAQRVRIMLSPKEDKTAPPQPTGGVAVPVLRPSLLVK
jgi:lipopolysaccharide export system protein LptA